MPCPYDFGTDFGAAERTARLRIAISDGTELQERSFTRCRGFRMTVLAGLSWRMD